MNETVLVYPLKAGGSSWQDQELKYSLRSVERYWKTSSGRSPRIVILGASRPDWLHGVEFRRAIKYKEALLAATELGADKVVWMNDDIVFLRDIKEVDLMPARFSGTPTEDQLKKYEASRNAWARRLAKCLRWSHSKGLPGRNYSTHTPYLYETAKMRDLLMRGPWYGYKTAFETLYFNLYHPDASQPCNDRWRPGKSQRLPANLDDLRFLNLTDDAIKAKDRGLVRGYLAGKFPEKSRYETKPSSNAGGDRNSKKRIYLA